MVSQSPRFIIAGGGPVGLTAALAFTKANIDFVLLERNSSAIIDAGSNLVLNPAGIRALTQLDLLDELDKVTSGLSETPRINLKAQDIGTAYWFDIWRDTLGYIPKVVSRHDLTSVMYNGLPKSAQDKVLTNKALSRIEETEDGVKAICADGSTYEGCALIGADGAHSVARREMRRLGLEAGSDRVNDDKPFLTTFRALWVRFPSEGLVPAGVTSETHGPGVAIQMFSGEDSTVAGLYLPMSEPTRDRVRYTQADQDAIIEQHGSIPVTVDGKVTLKSAYDMRSQSGLVNLEEGVAKYWSHDGKIVLIGDAAHKFTPSTGAGCNYGIVDVVILANQLHKLLQASPRPGKTQLEAAFREYQDVRFDDVVQACNASGGSTVMSTWQNAVVKFVDQYLLSFKMVQKFLVGFDSKRMAQTPAFSFIFGKERFTGTIPWAKPLRTGIAVQ